MSSTVTVSQGSENWLVIYSAGRGPHHQGTVCATALIDNPRDIYVFTIRSRQQIVYIAIEEFLRQNCKSSHPILHTLGRQL